MFYLVMSTRLNDISEISIKTILSKLAFISKIEENMVVDTRRMALYHNTWYTRAYRTAINLMTIFASGESRSTTLSFIYETINEAFDAVNKCVEENNKMKATGSDISFYENIGQKIITGIKDSIRGINELKKTYMDSTITVSEIDALIILINTKLVDIEKPNSLKHSRYQK